MTKWVVSDLFERSKDGQAVGVPDVE